ncbi:MAG: PKD domain-containing protein, partial [Planctomycetota bacterium]
IDGHEMPMERYVGSQESFYEPYVVNGMRVWFDGVRDIFEFLSETHGPCCPHKQARFALADAQIPICPEEVKPWCATARRFLDIEDCYNGEDCWMGAHRQGEAHGGLDVNHPKGTPIYTPIGVDDQFLANSLARGDGNNRWRGSRAWANGDTWQLGVSHLLRLLHPEHGPLAAGTHLAEGAAVGLWEHTHSHFKFSVTGSDEQEVQLDPWILFWQAFENVRDAEGSIRAFAPPLGPQQTGQAVAFSSLGSHASAQGSRLQCYWSFGDGGFSTEPNPSYTYMKAGIYPVTLTVDDGMYRDSCTQHITVDGEGVERPALALAAPEEPTFRPRPVQMMDTYGVPPPFVPNTLHFTARASSPTPRPRTVVIANSGGGALGHAEARAIEYECGADWLAVEPAAAEPQRLAVSVDVTALEPGAYSANVAVECRGAANSPQRFRVAVEVREHEPAPLVIIDDNYIGFYSTPYFWVGHRFHKNFPRGYNNSALINGGRARAGEFVRFTPDLAEGSYLVFFPRIVFCWQEKQPRFSVRVKHRNGVDTVWMQPKKPEAVDMERIWDDMTPDPPNVIGTFEFSGGTDGFVEVLAEGSQGQVPADAVVFKKLE